MSDSKAASKDLSYLLDPDYRDDRSQVSKVHYFVNEEVEDKLRRYIWTGCTDKALRDSVMSHAPELITQIIRKQNLHMIYPGHDDSAFGDLVQTAWAQLERVLYKFRAKPHCRVCYSPERPNNSALYVPGDHEYGIITYDELFGKEKNPDRVGTNLVVGRKCPHCKVALDGDPNVWAVQGRFGGSQTILFRGNSKVFNLFSQVSRTVILAFVKREGRDRKNSGSYKDHLSSKVRLDDDKMERFFAEVRELFKYNSDFLKCVDALRRIVSTDDRPYEGLIGKLARESKQSRVQVGNFMKMLRFRSHEFTDSPLNKTPENVYRNALQQMEGDADDE
jgi:hypothetical protein